MRIQPTITILILLLASSIVTVQAEPTPLNIKGKVVEGNGLNPIEFATVVLIDQKTETPILAVTTQNDGSFEFSSNEKEVYIEIRFLGFQTHYIRNLESDKKLIDLGTIELIEDSETLDEIVIRGEKSSMEFKLDKRVFNVGKDLSSTGASALEVLNNVPSVNVNIEGEISLRGSTGVQILINGKPSVLASEQGNALGTITAEMIDRIEVITNPSAKYDAEGTSGIINIVIKKEERKGANGSITLNTGTPHNHSLGLSLNKRTEKFNLFSQLGVGYRELPNDVENINRDFIQRTSVATIGEEFRNEQFYNVILGTDYYFNQLNVLTLSGHFAYEIEDQPSNTSFVLSDDVSGAALSEWNRTEVTEATNPKYQYELQFKRDYEDNEDHHLLFSALGNFFGKDQSSEFDNVTTSGDNVDAQLRTRTDFKEAKYTFKLDYSKPFTENFIVEVGSQYVLQHVSNDFEVADLVNEDFVVDPGLTNIFEYDQDVLGIYGTAAYEFEKLGIKLGLRMEHTDLRTFLVNTNERGNQLYTNLFPSFHTSYKVNDKHEFQAGYSRRIYRPRLWDLNPFFNIRNNFSIRSGNPDLRPEYTDSYEFSSVYTFGKVSLNSSIYHRYTTDKIERVSTFEDNVNNFRPENIGTRKETGFEMNTKVDLLPWLTINGDFNFNYFARNGVFESTVFDFSADQWSAKMISKFKLPANFDIEVTNQYRSDFRYVQGTQSGFYTANLGVRKKIIKNRGVINLSVRDVFRSRIFENEAVQDDFFAYRFRQRGRFITLGFSYGFGKGEAMEFSGQKRF